MRSVRVLAAAAVIALAAPGLTAAQDHNKTGITIGYPGDVGIIWHASDSVAIRPVFNFAHTTGSSAAGGDIHGTTVGLGVGALFYLKTLDTVRTYVSPQFTYSRASTKTTPPSTQATVASLDSSGHGAGANVAFGAQYTPASHFAVYGEFGFGYAHDKSTFNASSAFVSSSTGNAWGTFAGVGVIFYP